jgi:predicted HicB family RNase H-like nuclease
MKKGNKNIELYRKKTIQVGENDLNKNRRSKLEASKRYDQSVDIIKLRLPQGYKQQLKNIAETNSTSINGLLVELIKEKFDL